MNTAATNPRQCHRAFTLVELLVVVAIISVLAALLLPALQAARDRAKTVRCANNERQLSAAMSAFLNDHNGYFPYSNPAQNVGTWYLTYAYQILPYISTTNDATTNVWTKL